MLVLMLHYWRPFCHLGFTHSAGRRSCQSHYGTRIALLYISSLNHPVSPRAQQLTHMCKRNDLTSPPKASPPPPLPPPAPPSHGVQQPWERTQSTEALPKRRARPQTAGKHRLKRRIARAAAPAFQDAPNQHTASITPQHCPV